jgi:CheY-like chemotaxis protein
MRIAIADDEEDMRQYFRRLLPRFGHELIAEADNGRMLVDLCRADPPDLIITDINMPEMDGLQAATEIGKTQSTPIIVMSANDLPQDRTHEHIVEYLLKPVSATELQAAILRACPA